MNFDLNWAMVALVVGVWFLVFLMGKVVERLDRILYVMSKVDK